MTAIDRVGEQIIQHHSKSFALASKLLPPSARADAVAVYAWCRRADDAIDLVEPERQGEALITLRREVDAVYAGREVTDPVLTIFQRTVNARRIPIEYPHDLLDGMQMDAEERRYASMDDLLDYCYHVAGCVGLMMCHVMGVNDEAALRNAAHLGIAMQLTNICRDVEEDWERDRLYLPDDLLTRCGAPALADRLGGPFPEEAREPVARAIGTVLDEAERFYRSGDAGLPALAWRCTLAIRTARVVYSSIGDRIREQKCDPLAGRAWVSSADKMWMAAGSVAHCLTDLPSRAATGKGRSVAPPTRVARFPEDILPLTVATTEGRGARA